MKKKILIILMLLFIPILKVKAIDVNYVVHSQDKGWLSQVSNGSTGGTTGQSLRMEAIKLSLSNNSYSGTISYQVHVQNIGWMGYVNAGTVNGTTGRSLRMEAIRIKLTDELAENYDVYYRAHVEELGWMDWVKNDEIGGTTGQSLRMEAIQVKLVEKEDKEVVLKYSVHNTDGWSNQAKNNEVAGTTGQAKKLDLIKLDLSNDSSLSGDINYQVYNSTNDWQDVKTNGMESGVHNSNIEAIKINLTSELAKKYDIIYRVHASYVGWMGWTSNGNPAGTKGYKYNIEAIQIKIKKKGNSSAPISNNSFIELTNRITYSSHVSDVGWMDYVTEGKTSGTTGQSKRLEAFKIKLEPNLSGNVVYKTYVEKVGWSNDSNNNGISGTTGLSRKLEAIQIKLTGDISNKYDIYYRVHMSGFGWMGWAKNGESAGCTNSSLQVEAIEIKLLEKGIPFNGSTANAYRTGSWNGSSYYNVFGTLARGFKVIDGVKYYFNPDGVQYGKNVQKIIDVSSWQGTINWDTIKRDGDVDAAIIRVGWGTSYNDPCGLDSYFDRNIREVQRVGIPYGVYIYAYAENTAAAQKEADFVISKMNQYNMPKGTYVWYDAEIKSIPRNTYNTVIPAFINRIKANGYYNVGVYSGVSQLDTTNGNTNTPTIRSYPIWVSQYYKNLQYTGTYKGWQFASDERVNGISGDVDVSMFKK